MAPSSRLTDTRVSGKTEVTNTLITTRNFKPELQCYTESVKLGFDVKVSHSNENQSTNAVVSWQTGMMTICRKLSEAVTCLSAMLSRVMVATLVRWPQELHIKNSHFNLTLRHYYDVIMNTIASQIISLTIVYLTVNSGTDQRKHQSSASLAFVRGIHRRPVNSPHKGPVTRKMFPFDDVIMACNSTQHVLRSTCHGNLFRLVQI